jgi:hypothetical protein
LSFVRKPSFVSGTTTIRFKAERTGFQNVGHKHDVSRVDKHTLIIDGKPTDTEDPKSEPKVKITPYPQTIGKDSAVEFSVDYDVTDGTTRIKVLALYMFYDSDKLQWNGLAKDGVLGLVDDPSSDSPAPSLIKGWSSKHGEFENLDGWIDDDEDFTDGYDATDRMLYLRWRHNADQQLSTFRDEVSEKGFIGDNALPVELLKKVSFVRKPSFVSGTTTVRFKIEGISSGNVGAGHGFTSTSVVITGSDSSAFDNTDSSIVDENQTASGPVKVITEENNVTRVNAGNN